MQQAPEGFCFVGWRRRANRACSCTRGGADVRIERVPARAEVIANSDLDRQRLSLS